MTEIQKRAYVREYCDSFDDCKHCPLSGSKSGWCHNHTITFADEIHLDQAISIIKESEEPDMVNKPPHYTHGMECIDEMILVFGKKVVADFCLCNVWKYRKRAIFKNGEEDANKSDWYMAKYKELTESALDDLVRGVKHDKQLNL